MKGISIINRQVFPSGRPFFCSMNPYGLLLFLSISFWGGCKPYDMMGYFREVERDTQLLPHLTPVWNDQDFQAHYISQGKKKGPSKIQGLTSTPFELQLMYQHMINGGISQLSGDSWGYAVIQMDIQTRKTGLTALFSIVNYGLLGIPILMGSPTQQVKVDCIATVEVQDRRQKMLRTYRSKGSSEALYSFYLKNSRKLTNKAFEQAMLDLQDQIRVDFSYLEPLLLEQ